MLGLHSRPERRGRLNPSPPVRSRGAGKVVVGLRHPKSICDLEAHHLYKSRSILVSIIIPRGRWSNGLSRALETREREYSKGFQC